jgi:hypothetical protein
MDEFQDWLMTLEQQDLTNELKMEILSKLDRLIDKELIIMLKNLKA